MKKTAIILTLCMLASLVSCGKDELAEGNKPLNIQEATAGTTTTNEVEEYESPFKKNPGNFTPHVTGAVTGDTAHNGSITTAVRTGSAILVKRTGGAVPNVPPSRGNVVIPYASNVVKPTKTTSEKAPETTKKNTTKKRPNTTTTTVTTTVTQNTADVTNGDITCRVTEKGVEIIRKGKVIQVIEVDTEQMLAFYKDDIIDPSTLINISDFDFDGYDDLFIPQEIGTLNTLGIYMHYNPETETFEDWEEMADINVCSQTDDDGKLHTTVKNSALENTSRTYVWNEDKQLVLVESIVQYKFDDSSEIYIDYFEYPDGVETLVKRERMLFDENNEYIGTEEVPLEQDTTEPPTEPPTEETTENSAEETTEQ